MSFLETYLLVWVDDIFGLAEAINHGLSSGFRAACSLYESSRK